jgi:hypothetical protein
MKKSSEIVKFIFSIGLILWIVIIVSAYYVVHKPGPLDKWTRFFSTMFDAVLALTFVILAGGIGRRILGHREIIGPLERVAVNTSLGLGLISLLVLLIGVIGLLYSWLVGGLLILAIPFFRKDIYCWLLEWKYLFSVDKSGWLNKIAAGFVVFVIILGLIQALAPPLKWDSLVYHLELPKQYVAAKRIGFLENNVFVGFPQLAEIIYSMVMTLASAKPAAFVGGIVGIIALLGVEGLTRRLVGSQVAWLAPAILLSGSHIAQSLSWAYVDLWVMLFGLVMIISLDSYLRSREWIWLVVAGLMIGFGMSTKYTAGLLLPVGMLFVFVDEDGAIKLLSSLFHLSGAKSNLQKERYLWRKVLLNILILTLIGLFVFSPWIIKNVLMTGNPLYPLVFKGREVDELRLSWYKGVPPDRTILDDVLLPWDVTIFGVEGGKIEGSPDYDSSIGPLILALIPGLLGGWKGYKRNQIIRLKQFLFIALMTWLGWGLASHMASALTRARHYFGLFPIFAVLASAGYKSSANLFLPKVRVQRLVAVLIILVFSLSGLKILSDFVTTNPLPVLLGLEMEIDYLADELGWYGPTIDVVNNLPSGSQIKFFWEPRAFHCEIECDPDEILDNWWYLRRTVGSASDIALQLYSEGVTHILIYDLGVHLEKEANERFTALDWDELENFKDEELYEIAVFEDVYSLYALKQP